MPNLIHQLTIKLTSNNFLIRKTQLLPLLKGSGLACHLDNSVSPPPQLDSSNQINPAFTQWEQLVQAYDSGSKSQIHELKYHLHSFCRDNDSIPIYVQNAKSISDQLAALQSPVSDDDLVEYVLDGLGPAYSPFVSGLEARLHFINFDDLYGLLLSNEHQLAKDDTNVSGSSILPSALVAFKQISASRADLDNLHQYQGLEKVVVCNGFTLPIAHTDLHARIHLSKMAVLYESTTILLRQVFPAAVTPLVPSSVNQSSTPTILSLPVVPLPNLTPSTSPTSSPTVELSPSTSPSPSSGFVLLSSPPAWQQRMVMNAQTGKLNPIHPRSMNANV
ncbi:hypothetical protein ACH5RR_013101 [Cinchona calisaya]|uniref:Uncharacterized protein n=1 Tax=Cinchona calisaya TaxID=153742 RepID=A0ABD2ZZ38_9GENT